MQFSHLEMMPYEVLENIISNMTDRDLAKMSRLNRRFYVYISNMPIWRELTRTKFASEYIDKYLHISNNTPFFRIYAIEMMFEKFLNLEPYLKSIQNKIDLGIGTGMWSVVVLSGPFIYDAIKHVSSLSKPVVKSALQNRILSIIAIVSPLIICNRTP